MSPRRPPDDAPTRDDDADESERRARRRLSWAQLLARVFLIDVLRCPHCGGRRRIVSFIIEPRTIRRILAHLGLPTDPPPRLREETWRDQATPGGFSHERDSDR